MKLFITHIQQHYLSFFLTFSGSIPSSGIIELSSIEFVIYICFSTNTLINISNAYLTLDPFRALAS